MTKIYCDIADIKLIKKYNKKKIVKGFTTNPSLMRKAQAKDYEFYSKKILKITKKPVSLEVFGDSEKSMMFQGSKISKWGKNVYVKVPITNSKGKFTGKVIKYLNNTNVVHTRQKAIIVSFGFIDICPKNVGFKNKIINEIKATFLLNNNFDNLYNPKIVSIEKVLLIK